MTYVDRLLELAFDEDLGAAGDITTLALVPENAVGRAELWAKEPMVLSGMGAFARAFELFDPAVSFEPLAKDGDLVTEKKIVAKLKGSLRSLLTAERTALNVIQRTSGMATLARQAANAVRGSKLRVLDTRKTAPGMRGLSKAAIREGGATNHRFGLFDGILIKDNHIAAVGGSIAEALARAQANAPRLVKIEIEVTTLEQLDEAIAHGAHIVMLDNMDDALVAEAVKRAGGRVELEVSGGVTVERLPILAKLGVDYVSLGALTHSARAVDLSLEIIQS